MDRKGILVVDDETLALKYFSRAFGNRFKIYSAASAEEALKVLESHRTEIGVIVTDQRMPEATGIELLKIVRARYPGTVRILTTAYSELDTLIEAINAGAIFSFVSKPWELDELERILVRALDHHDFQVQDALLIEQKIDELKAKILEDRAYEVGLISAKIGHYVHNALCPLMLLVDHLLERSQDRSTNFSTDFLQNIRVHINDVARTLKDLEQISVPPSPSGYKWLNVEEILDKVLSDTTLLRDQKQLTLEKKIVGTLPTIMGVPEQIEKVFRFMIAEEVVSLPAESHVNVRLHPHEADGEILGLNIEFEDSVPVSAGINPESLLHPFNLRGSNPREFGIFLVSCYFIVRHHGGSLHAKIKENQEGVCFSFFLPCDPRETTEVYQGMLTGFPVKPRPRR